MKGFIVGLWLIGCCLQAQAQPLTLPRPGGWGAETFTLPPSFATSIPYTGTEHLRFAPKWADSAAQGYWSYVFAWELQGAITPSADSLRRHLISYYNGLYIANKKVPPAGYGTMFTQVRITVNKPWAKDNASFTGKVYTYNYLTGQQLDLLLKVHVRAAPDGKHTAILVQASPKPYSQAIWQTLQPIVDGAIFTKAP